MSTHRLATSRDGNSPIGNVADLDVLIVGAGFAGLYLLRSLEMAGFKAMVFEAGDGVGGTWYWNRYPGARCDVESVEYSFSFDRDLEQEWTWPERYADQPTILAYLEHVADRFDLRRHIRFGTRVTSMRWNAGASHWIVHSENGDGTTARFVVMATGCLSSANLPDISGRDDFAGSTYHTARWPHEGVDFTGQRVAIVGTGSSGIQAIPMIAREAADLVVFQRTPVYAVPARNGPVDPDEMAAVKADYLALRAISRKIPTAYGSRSRRPGGPAFQVTEPDRIHEYEARWQEGGLTFVYAYSDLLSDDAANETAAEFVRLKIRDIVMDPVTADALAPTHPIGCKRLCLDTNYYETFNRDNVRLVDLRTTPITEITAEGVRTSSNFFDLDALVFATGFDAMTGALLAVDILGCSGRSLRDAWTDGPRNYLGLSIPDFPNFFTVTGPGSPSVLTNMIVSIEHHVEWITDCLSYLRSTSAKTIEAESDAADAWVSHVNRVASRTLFPTCNSWYLGANIPGKPRIFMPLPGFPEYAQHCAAVADQGYPGFKLAP